MTKKVIYQRLWGFLCVLLLMTGTAFSQQPTPGAVKGIVKGEQGEPLQGVTINVQNKNKSFDFNTFSDEKGMFSIANLPQGGPYSFTFSSVGYDKKTLEGYNYHSGEVITLSVKLTKVNKALDEVVVVGYGTEKKANLTGAVDQIGTQYFDDRPMPNVTRGLEGVIPNLNITVSDGKPTATSIYNIRGITSIGAGATQGALVLVDGVVGDPTQLNPADIASVTILKDAASAAIYGSRGAFGVVLITTKSPTANKLTVTYSPSFGVMSRTVTPKLVNNGYQYATTFDSAYTAWYDYTSQPATINTVVPFSATYLDSLQAHNANPGEPQVTVNPTTGAYNYYGNTNWQKDLYAPYIPMTSQSLAVSGGTDKVNFYLSGRYYNQGGIFRQNSDQFHRYNLLMKGFAQATKWLSFNSSTTFSAFDYKYPQNSITEGNIWQDLASASPTVAVMYNPDGTLTQAAAYGLGGFFNGESYSLSKQYFIRNTLGFDATIVPGMLELKGDFSYLYTSTNILSQLYPVQYSTAPGVIITSPNNSLDLGDSTENYYAGNLYAQFHHNYGPHSIGLTVGGNLESDVIKYDSVIKNGLIVPNLPDMNLATGAVSLVSGGGSQWATVGIFYRANYSFRDKYLLELDGRYDGSSKFPTSQQFGFFPSASAGWRINRENFLESTRKWLDNWKIRASYGTLGNGQISPYLYLPIMQSGNTIINGSSLNYLANPNVIPNGLTWEKSTTTDIGTDIDVLHRRLSVTYDWYERQTIGMITQSVPLPSVFGAATPNGNNANLQTKGWELSVNWNDQVRMHKPLTYGIRATLSHNNTIITKFNNPTGILSSYYAGERYGDIWGFVTQGFYTSAADIASSPNQTNYVSVSNSNIPQPGDIKFADIRKQGAINNGSNTLSNPGDQTIIGNSQAHYRYSFTPYLNWDNFTLSAFIQGVGHQSWWPGEEADYFWGQYNRPYSFIPEATLNHWEPNNPNAYFPRYRGYVALSGTRELALTQTRYLQNVAYIRLKNLSLAYDLPRSVTERLRVIGLKVYFTGQNIWTHSPLYKHTKAYDPEVIGTDPAGGSGAGNDYPMLKSYTLGLNLTF